jgi:hypothetical protein
MDNYVSSWEIPQDIYPSRFGKILEYPIMRFLDLLVRFT